MKEKEIERILKALANRRRLAIIRFIRKEKEVSVGEIAKEIRLSFKSTSRHLAVLAAADILEKEQKSSLMLYRLVENFPEILKRLSSLI